MQPFGWLGGMAVWCCLKEPPVRPRALTVLTSNDVDCPEKKRHRATRPEQNARRMKMLYLAYGSNLNLEQMAGRCPTAKVAGAAMLEDYQLLFRGRHSNAVATVEQQEGSNVPVLLWKITSTDEASLDHYEGWPYLYRKETVSVTLDGKEVDAMAYIMNEGRPLGKPSCDYYSIILQGYRSAGFDVDILKQAVNNSKA